MFPIRDENPHFLTPYVTYGVVALNVVAWVFVQGLGAEEPLARSICDLGLVPGELSGRAPAGMGRGIDRRQRPRLPCPAVVLCLCQ